MKTKLLLLCCLLISVLLFGQKRAETDWYAFSQRIDIREYIGGNFRFEGYVKTVNGNKLSQARLWARIDKKKGRNFFDNMQDRPIMSEEWASYIIEGPIEKGSTELLFGGLSLGNGKYYFDNFSIQVEINDQWIPLNIENAGFENQILLDSWRPFNDKSVGFEVTSSAESIEGQTSLLIDASGKSSSGQFIKTNDIEIYYEAYGKGDTLLLLHGNAQSVQSFEHQISELAKHFYVIAMDSRGQGYSTHDGTPLSYELMAEDVYSFLERKRIKRTSLLGWSDGANIGLILAMKYPDKITKLALMSANLYNDPSSVDEKTNKMLRKERSKLAQDSLRHIFDIEMIDMLLTEPNIKPFDLAKIKCKTLVMAGSKDIIKSEHTKLIADHIDQSTLLFFKGGDHFEPVKNPDRFNKVVLNFLNTK